MFRIDESTGNITLRQGDNGKYPILGLPNDRPDYVVYFAIQDENRKPIGGEISQELNGNTEVTFNLLSDFTDLLTVKKNQPQAIYYFGIKLCSESANIEDTLIIGDSDIDTLNTITVLPKKVEGTSNG